MQNGWTFHVIWCSGVRQAGSWTTLQQWFFCFGWPVWGTPSLDWGRFTSRLHCLIRHQLGLAVLLAKGYRAEWTCWTSSWNHFINQLKLEHCLSLHKFSNWIGRRVLWQWQVGALCGKANAAEPFAKCFAEPLPRHLQRSHLSSQKGELLFECGSTVWDMWIEWKWFELVRNDGWRGWFELIRTERNEFDLGRGPVPRWWGSSADATNLLRAIPPANALGRTDGVWAKLQGSGSLRFWTDDMFETMWLYDLYD